MVLPEATRIRLPKIKAGLLANKTSEQIAKECGVKRQTIERDKQEWRQSGDFEDWIKEEWMRLHLLIQKQDPVIAYREITRLLGKTLTQKVETALTQKEPFVVKMWKPEKDAKKQP